MPSTIYYDTAFEIRVPNTSTIRAMEDVNVGTLESFESVTALMASIDENN